jgi:two-component system phosphate regulon sensor histidine kinase PhoR
VLVLFVAVGALSLGYAVAGLIVLALVALVDRAPRAAVQRPAALAPPQARAADGMIEALLAGLPDPVLLIDRDGRVLASNPAAEALAPALRRGEPVPLGLRVPEVLDALRQAQATGQPQRVEFSERVPIDRWFAANVSPISRAVAAGMPGGLVLISFDDLTPLRRVEEMRADFVANASHELRTPLASLSGFIDTLQGPARDDAAARERFIGIMKAQATRMARLIDDLLSLSRIELNVHVRPQTPIDLISILRQVADALQMLARDRGVTIGIDAPSEPLLVPGDRDELIRVFENLVENALK